MRRRIRAIGSTEPFRENADVFEVELRGGRLGRRGEFPAERKKIADRGFVVHELPRSLPSGFLPHGQLHLSNTSSIFSARTGNSEVESDLNRCTCPPRTKILTMIGHSSNSLDIVANCCLSGTIH